MSPKERFPHVTPTRTLIVVACGVIAATIIIVAAHNEWVIGITAGLAVSVASTLGIRWRNQDAEIGDRESAS